MKHIGHEAGWEGVKMDRVIPNDYTLFTIELERLRYLTDAQFRKESIKLNSFYYKEPKSTDVFFVRVVGHERRWKVVIQFEDGILHTIPQYNFKKMQTVELDIIEDRRPTGIADFRQRRLTNLTREFTLKGVLAPAYRVFDQTIGTSVNGEPFLIPSKFIKL